MARGPRGGFFTTESENDSKAIKNSDQQKNLEGIKIDDKKNTKVTRFELMDI